MIHFKSRGANRFECWIEEWVGNDWKIVAESKGFTAGDTFLVDDIKTDPKFKRKGYASQIIEKLLSTGHEVRPIGVLKTEAAQGFWKKFNMTDALGPEDYIFQDSEGNALEGYVRELADNDKKSCK